MIVLLFPTISSGSKPVGTINSWGFLYKAGVGLGTRSTIEQQMASLPVPLVSYLRVNSSQFYPFYPNFSVKSTEFQTKIVFKNKCRFEFFCQTCVCENSNELLQFEFLRLTCVCVKIQMSFFHFEMCTLNSLVYNLYGSW